MKNISLKLFLMILTLIPAGVFAKEKAIKGKESKVKNMKVEFVKSKGGISEYRFKNGLRILLKPIPSAQMLSWQVWYRVGARNEKTAHTGLAHYLEHIMFKGTETFKKGEIAQAIQLRGGIFNAFTSDDYTAYFENLSPENLELGIKIEADRMKNSRLDAAEVDLERSVIVSELEGNENNPNRVLYRVLSNTAYAAHPYRNPVIGYKDDLSNIDAKVMRRFYERYYHPNNATAVLIGNFDQDTALDLIEKYFGAYEAADKKELKITQEPEQEGEKRVVMKQDVLLKLLGIAFHIPEFNHEDTPALHVLADILFGGTSSRLYQKLVDAGYATRVNGNPEANIDPGLFRITANIMHDKDIKEVECLILEEFEAIKKDIKEDELKRAKARVEASAIYERDGVYEEGLQIGFFEMVAGDWTKYVDWVEDINKVTLDKLKAVAKKYFVPSNMTVVSLLPEKPAETLLEHSEPVKQAQGPASTKLVEAYGAGAVEPLSPEKLERLLKITEPKYSKDLKKPKLDLGIQNIDLGLDGVSLVFKEDHNLPIVYMNAMFYAGTINDIAEGKPGLASITAKMLDRGTKKHTRFELSELLDLYGGDVDVKARDEYVVIEYSTIRKNWIKIRDILKEMLYEPLFDAKELAKLKDEMIASIKQENEYPANVRHRELKRLIFPESHPYYAYSPEEKVKFIESITIDDVKSFYERYYNRNNLIVSVVGDMNAAEVKELVLSVFDAMKYAKDAKYNVAPKISLVEAKAAETKELVMQDKQQVEIAMGHSNKVDRTHEDFYPLLLANYSLGGSPLSSKLGAVVRDDNGLVYNVRSSFDASLGAGPFKVVLGCNPNNTTRAIELTKKTIAEYVEAGVTETELQSSKMYLSGSFAARNLSSNEDIAYVLATLKLYGLADDYIETYSELINSYGLEQVNKVMRKHIHADKLHTVIVGPKI